MRTNLRKNRSRYAGLVTVIMLLCVLIIGCGSKKTDKPGNTGNGNETGSEEESGQKTLLKYSTTEFGAFDTVTVITGYDENEETFAGKATALIAALRQYHKLYDIYNDYEGIANVKTINDHAGIEPVEVDPAIIDMIEYGRELYETTNGKTNIAMGSVLRIWHDHRSFAESDPEHASIPTMEELRRAAEHTDFDQVIVDREKSTVFLADPEMSLDVGAVAKGYATDRLADIAKENGWDHMLLSVGGNIRTIGKKPGDVLWRVGIQTPEGWDKDTFCALELEDCSLVTSGSYQRYFTVDGKQYHHIIDPDTLMPEDRFLSVSIVCEESGMGDVLSTALFNMTFEEGKEIIDSLPNVEAVWVYPDGTYVYSEGLENRLQ